MKSIHQVETEADRLEVRALFWEYLQWANERLKKEFDVNFDIESMLERDMAELDIFSPRTADCCWRSKVPKRPALPV